MNRRLVWNARTGEFAESADEPVPTIIDSWLLDNGVVRALDRHRARFRRACQEAAGVPAAVTDRFFSAAVHALPRTGRWFPRVEWVAEPESFQLAIRPCPELTHTVSVWVGDQPDLRTCPGVKGPDLAYLRDLGAHAREAGANEALLVSRSGYVLEGTTTSVLWWRDDVLMAPPPEAPTLPSVTRDLVFSAARFLGWRVGHEYLKPAELDGLEVWTVNALHGIRPVAAWLGAELRPAASGRRAASWQRHLSGVGRPI